MRSGSSRRLLGLGRYHRCCRRKGPGADCLRLVLLLLLLLWLHGLRHTRQESTPILPTRHTFRFRLASCSQVLLVLLLPPALLGGREGLVAEARGAELQGLLLLRDGGEEEGEDADDGQEPQQRDLGGGGRRQRCQ